MLSIALREPTVSTVDASRLSQGLRRIVGADGVLAAQSDLVVYECDGFVIEKNCPTWSSFPVHRRRAAIVKLCNEFDVPFVPRGAGTSLAGGCLPVGGGVMIVLTRMKRDRRRSTSAIATPSCSRASSTCWLTNALKGTGFHYAPDPSSQGACTIGGNVATNSGGPHTLKYGVTVNHVLGVEAVTADGAIVQIRRAGRRRRRARSGRALIVGSEGTLGIVTKVWVRLTRDPQGYRTMLGVFDSVDDATQRDQRDHRRGHRSGGAGDDGSRNPRRRRSRRFTSASRSTPRRSC